jgi:cullin-associated NEDD8-dissociated protein 1
VHLRDAELLLLPLLLLLLLLLLQVASKDKDFRYMATSDLLNELSRDTFQVGAQQQELLKQYKLQLLPDSSRDVF